MHREFEELKQNFHTLKSNTVIDRLRTIETGRQRLDLKPIKVALLRSYTVEPLEPFLKLRFICEGYDPEFAYGGYGQFSQEILDEESFLYRFKPDIVLFLMRADDVLPELNNNPPLKPESTWLENVTGASDQIATHIRRIKDKLNTRIICQNLSCETTPYLGVYDAQQWQGQAALISTFNQNLAKQLADISNAYVWDYAQFLTRKGFETVYDPKMWYLSKNPFKYSASPEIVHDLFRTINGALGNFKKCIVTDLDNTLWGGIVGEDGFDRIQLGEDYPGACYRDLQKELLKLYHRGIVLAINSRNNEEEAFEVIENHPDMILRKKHFAAHRINWNDKATNLEELAKDLNIGIDSMIFIDDNSRECELVRQMHPECLVVQLPDKKYELPAAIRSLSNIDNIQITDEDRKKGTMYQSQKERRDAQQAASSLEEYLRNLEVVVAIKKADPFAIPRIAQLTQKTNQMNLTTRRYSESEILSLAQAPLSDVFYVSVKDRLGDHGIVGVIILKSKDSRCLVDTFLLSCRVLGLTVEETMLAFIKERAKGIGCKTLIGEYIPTKKNKPAEGIYEKAHFTKKDNTRFVFALDKEKKQEPFYVKLESSYLNSESLVK